MDTSMFQEFISPLALAASFAVGFVLKNLIATSGVNRFIPLCCAATGVIITCWAGSAFTADLVVSGMISGLAATGIHQAFKQASPTASADEQ